MDKFWILGCRYKYATYPGIVWVLEGEANKHVVLRNTSDVGPRILEVNKAIRVKGFYKAVALPIHTL